MPIITTKRVYWKTAVKEMLWFLTGGTNIRPLLEENVHIWTDWPLASYRRETGEDIPQDEFERRVLDDDAFAARWGELGPVYGKQWRRWARRGRAGARPDSGPRPHVAREPGEPSHALPRVERERTGVDGSAALPHGLPIPRDLRRSAQLHVAPEVRRSLHRGGLQLRGRCRLPAADARAAGGSVVRASSSGSVATFTSTSITSSRRASSSRANRGRSRRCA